jgi:signal transduction histidine kinase
MEFIDETLKYLCQEGSRWKENLSNSFNKNRYSELLQALALERELYMDLTNALPLGIYRLRVFHEEGIKADKWNSLTDAPYAIEFVNEHFCEIVNIGKKEFIDNPAILHGYVHEDNKAEFIQRNVEANLYTIPFSWEGKFIKENETLWIHFESIPRVLENKDIIWTGFLEDISARKRAEEELRQKNKELHLLNAEKDKFFSIIAHDLRSPFNSIIGFSGILLEKLNQPDSNIAEIKDYAEIIRSSSQRAMNLLLNLMQWTQTQTGRMDFNPEIFDLTKLIEETVLLYENDAAHREIQIMNESPAVLKLYADKAMISTILRNLISNALKFTYKGGKIEIITTDLSNGVLITVKDTGVGMTKAVMDRIFHIDANLSFPDLNGNKGTGLGLVLCKEFAEKHQGTISLESEPGIGSAFHVTIPKKEMDNIND